MAGAGFKDFAVGEVLTASDVDTYLMQQSVMRFADAAARGSALGTAVGAGTALAEGMVSYLDDTNYVQVYDGSGWTSAIPGIGSNVVSTIKSDAFSASLGSGSETTITGLSATITPTSATSKVLVILTVQISGSGDLARGADVTVLRDSTRVGIGDAASNRRRVSATSTQPGGSAGVTASTVFLDSPATTSATTYTVELGNSAGATQTLYVNRSNTDTDTSQYPRSASVLTLIEVAA